MSAPDLNLPVLPEGIDPNQTVVSVVSFECRTCGDRSPWVDGQSDDAVGHAWDGDHADETGHRRFYMWTFQRSTAQVSGSRSVRRDR